MILYIIVLRYIHSLNKNQIEIIGANEILDQSYYRSTGVYSDYTSITLSGITDLIGPTFTDSKKLKSIELCSTIKSIGSSCFSSCSYLESLSIPNGVSAILKDTFLYCSSLRFIYLPDSLSKISPGSFPFCQNLHFNISESNQYFSTDASRTLLILNKTIAVTCTSQNSSITLPNEVETISSLFIFRLSSIRTILFEPESNLKIVSDEAFRGSGLKNISFPNRTKILQSSIFHECSIDTVFLPSSLTNISLNVFNGADQVINIILDQNCDVLFQRSDGIILDQEKKNIIFIPSTISFLNITKNIESIDLSMIRANRNIDDIETEENHSFYFAHFNVIYDSSKTKLLANIGSNKVVEVIDECQEISVYAFTNTLIENVTFKGSNVHTLEMSAFIGCRFLRYVVFAEGLKAINSWCFQSSGLMEAIFPSSLVNVSANAFSSCYIQKADFSNCYNIIKLNEGIFNSCPRLTNLKLPPNLTSIPKEFASNCGLLEVIKIPYKVEILEISSFSGSGIKTIEFETNDEGNSNLTILDSKCLSSTKLVSIRMPDSVKRIGSEALSNCPVLENIIFSKNSKLEIIEEKIISGSNLINSLFIGPNVSEFLPTALSGAFGLADIEISPLNPFFESPSGSGTIYQKGLKVLVLCGAGVRSVSIDGSVNQISDSAFWNCNLLNSVRFLEPSNLSSIGASTFYGCSGIKELTLPSQLERIDENAFSGCLLLETVRIPSSSVLTTLGSSAFDGCVKLREIKLPPTMTRVSKDALGRCTGLRRISICVDSKLSGFSDDAVDGCSDDLIVEVSANFNGKKLFGRNVHRILDKHCNVPTEQFTPGSENIINSIILVTESLYCDSKST